jgi:hypothetical protein
VQELGKAAVGFSGVSQWHGLQSRRRVTRPAF